MWLVSYTKSPIIIIVYGVSIVIIYKCIIVIIFDVSIWKLFEKKTKKQLTAWIYGK